MVDGTAVQEAAQKLAGIGRKFWGQLTSDKARESLVQFERVVNDGRFRELADKILSEES